MTRLIGTTALFAVLMIGTLPAHAGFKKIRTEAEYRAQVVDRTLRQGNSTWFLSNADGRLTGEHNGSAFNGAWKWSGRYYCRNGAFAGQEPIGSDCTVVEIDGNTVRYTRKKGRGETTTYTRE